MRALLYAFPLLAAAIGCSAPVVGQGAGQSESDAEVSTSAATAVVLIERTVSAGENPRAEAVARFVRMRTGAVDDEALRMVGATLDFPALGTCATVGTNSTPVSGLARALELVDVGSISVEANGQGLSLQPRRIPDIVDLVSGVVYSTRALDPDSLPSGAAYVLHASGRVGIGNESDLAPFSVAATAPREPDELFVASQDAKISGGLVLSPETPVDLTWGAGSPDDVVYVDVTQLGGSGARTVRCMFDDVGRGVIAASAFESGEGTLTIHRLHSEPFQTHAADTAAWSPRVDTGEIRFDFARVVAFRK